MEELLYKYRSFDQEDEWTTQILTGHQLYFASPTEFNDPFDCHVELSLDGSPEEWIQYIFRIVSEQRSDLTPAQQRIEAFSLIPKRI